MLNIYDIYFTLNKINICSVKPKEKSKHLKAVKFSMKLLVPNLNPIGAYDFQYLIHHILSALERHYIYKKLTYLTFSNSSPTQCKLTPYNQV